MVTGKSNVFNGFLVALTMLIMWGLPKIKQLKKLPEALIAILVVSTIAILSHFDVATVGSFIRDGGGEGLKGGLPFKFRNVC